MPGRHFDPKYKVKSILNEYGNDRQDYEMSTVDCFKKLVKAGLTDEEALVQINAIRSRVFQLEPVSQEELAEALILDSQMQED